MRISDWSSDVCSSDLQAVRWHAALAQDQHLPCHLVVVDPQIARLVPGIARQRDLQREQRDRKSVVSGKSVSVRVDTGGRRIIKKQKSQRIAGKKSCTTSKRD